MIWRKKPSRRSDVPPRPGGSVTARSSSPVSRKPSGSERAKPGWTPSEHWSDLIGGPVSRKGTYSMTTAKDVLKLIKENDVKYVDCRFTDPRGKWQHVTFDVGMFDEEAFAEGVMFDGSSIAGWKAINESDMNLMPDPASAT